MERIHEKSVTEFRFIYFPFIDILNFMVAVTLSGRKPVSRLEVPSSSWLYLNHLHGQEDTLAHDHNFLEMAFILKGSARHFTIDGEKRSSPGDIYLIPLGAWHGYCDCKNMEIFNCLLSPVLLERELAWMKDDPVFSSLMGLDVPAGLGKVRRLRAAPATHGALLDLLINLEAAYKSGRSRMKILGMLFLIFDFIQSLAKKQAPPTSPNLTRHPAIRQAIDLMHAHMEEDWSLAKFARLLRMNPSYLVRLFRAETGASPMKMLSRIRAERAATLLLSHDARVGDVGLAVGWAEPKQFATCFRRYFGLSASAYRQKMAKPLGNDHPRYAETVSRCLP